MCGISKIHITDCQFWEILIYYKFLVRQPLFPNYYYCMWVIEMKLIFGYLLSFMNHELNELIVILFVVVSDLCRTSSCYEHIMSLHASSCTLLNPYFFYFLVEKEAHGPLHNFNLMLHAFALKSINSQHLANLFKGRIMELSHPLLRSQFFPSKEFFSSIATATSKWEPSFPTTQHLNSHWCSASTKEPTIHLCPKWRI